MSAEPRFTAADLIDAALIAGPDDPPTDSWTPQNLNDLPDEPPVKPDLGGTGLVYPGKRHVFSGPPESAKTLAAYCVLIQTVSYGGSAVLIDFEMGPHDARQRLRELGATPEEIGRILYLEPDQPATIQRIASLVHYRPNLVVVDAAAGAYQLESLDDNKRGDVEKIAQLYVTVFWRNGIATIFIDHVVKNTETRGRFVIGSERKLGGADVHLGFEPVKEISRGTKGHYKILVHKDRGGYLKRGHYANLHLESDPDTHQIEWTFSEPAATTSEGGYFRPTHVMEKVSIDLEHREEAVSRNTVHTAVGGSKPTVLKAIDALLREHFVTETDGPNRAKLIESTFPYRENDPSCNPENPASGSVVREWFSSGSRTTTESGGSVVRSPGGSETTRPPTSLPPEPAGWFSENGNLADTDPAWVDSIAPDPDDVFGEN